MELIRTMMLNVILIVFLTTLLDLLLPDGSMRSYVKMTMGFFVVLTLLQPVMQLLQPDGILQQWQITMPAVDGELMAVQGTNYEEQQRQIDQLYQDKLNEQIESLLLLSTELNQLHVDCTVEEQSLKQIQIFTAPGEQVEAARISQALSGYYGLDSGQIIVTEEPIETTKTTEQNEEAGENALE